MVTDVIRSYNSAQHLRIARLHDHGDVQDRDPNHPDLSSRIKHILDVMEWNQSDLAREIDATPGAVGNWLHRDQQMDASYAFILQDKHRWNARWILEGVGPARMEVADEDTERLFREVMGLPAERRRAFIATWRVLLGVAS
jgi:hypothetical protein